MDFLSVYFRKKQEYIMVKKLIFEPLVDMAET